MAIKVDPASKAYKQFMAKKQQDIDKAKARAQAKKQKEKNESLRDRKHQERLLEKDAGRVRRRRRS